jgi:hypothetical protein
MSENTTNERPRRRSTQGRYRPPTWRSLVVIVSFAAALAVYLFVNAPPPLAAAAPAGARIPIHTVFAMLNNENAAARALWTDEIVGRGTAVGLSFDEHWRDDTVHAGPLPALFLRETARNLQKTPARLNLFLGSPHPLNAANQFTGEQAAHFDALVQKHAPQYFVDAQTGLQTAMFADVAVSDTCASCHNEHANAPKTDWHVHDVMGATTWMYPDATVTTEQAIALVRALRTSIRETYASYLAKVATFPSRPTIGTTWPRDGFALPTADVFMAELARRSSSSTLLSLLDGADAPTIEPAPMARASTEPRDTLVIRSARATRVIVEHDGNRLLVARLLPGTATTLSSPPPLRLLLSNPDGVEVKYGAATIPVPSRTDAEPSKDVEVLVSATNREKS